MANEKLGTVAATMFQPPISSLGIWRRKARRLFILQGFRFSTFQFGLAVLGGFGGIGSGNQAAFLNEVAPSRMTICGVLGLLKIF